MQIKFNDGTALDVLNVKGVTTYSEGASRDALEIQLAKTAMPLEELDKLTADKAKTGKLTILKDGVQFIHDNYCIRTELAIKPIDGEERVCITLAQLTFLEQAQMQQADDMVLQAQAIAELSALVATGGAK